MKIEGLLNQAYVNIHLCAVLLSIANAGLERRIYAYAPKYFSALYRELETNSTLSMCPWYPRR
jgi:hypothetical protein